MATAISVVAHCGSRPSSLIIGRVSMLLRLLGEISVDGLIDIAGFFPLPKENEAHLHFITAGKKDLRLPDHMDELTGFPPDASTLVIEPIATEQDRQKNQERQEDKQRDEFLAVISLPHFVLEFFLLRRAHTSVSSLLS